MPSGASHVVERAHHLGHAVLQDGRAGITKDKVQRDMGYKIR